MKINHIHIRTFQGIGQADIQLDPVTLICGRNGAGKSSIADAVRLALTGQLPRVSLKRDAAALVKAGARSGLVRVTTDEGMREITLPKLGKAPADAPAMLPFLLDPQRIAAQEPNALRSMLFDAMRVQTDRTAIAQRMERAGCDKTLVAEVLPLLRLGFPAVAEHAKSQASQARGAWKSLTGETYGSEKANTWAPVVPRFDPADYAHAKQEADDLEKRILVRTRDAAHVEADIAARVRAQKEITQLAEQAGMLERLQAKLQVDQEEERAMSQLVKDAQQSAQRAQAMACPCCGALLRQSGGMLYEVASDATSPQKNDAVDRLPEYEAALRTAQSAVRNSLLGIERAKMAAERLQQLDAEHKEDPRDLPLVHENMLAEISALKHKRKAIVQDTLPAFESAMRAAESAADRQQQASQHHAAVQAWEQIAEVMAPSGIPAMLLADALEPLNEHLEDSCKYARWKAVRVREDMTITYGGRAYALLSESERWRVDAALGQALAVQTGLRVLLLDRIDVLDLTARSDLIDWLEWCAPSMDTVLLLGTLKAKPELPDGMAAHWIEEGDLVVEEVIA